jgi:hypothetical protein
MLSSIRRTLTSLKSTVSAPVLVDFVSLCVCVCACCFGFRIKGGQLESTCSLRFALMEINISLTM